MTKQLKINYLWLFTLTILFTACNEDIVNDSSDGSVVTKLGFLISNKNEATNIDSIYCVLSLPNSDEYYIFQRNKYNNERFDIIFPTSIPEKNFHTDYFDGLTLTDNSVKIAIASFYAHSSSSLSTLSFSNGSIERPGQKNAIFIFADKEVKITGIRKISTITANYDVSLKSGWNIIIGELTKTSPNPEFDFFSQKDFPNDFKWYY